ncbi:uncharacterized protein F4807DRAFT_315301 [Annulohypoxylon truncatum]|uniref:uncharacterized protein n=1 Tax=Annulohypoxylon truncatum TaxID=327061 RepID=UPI00200808BA|nr:uncharacterized protein F4807DRAFT_315301 [Annulohypoxylon truncatum]KAI1204882.1 hypothetical protein F4807DRAFT_315301 [Annulohypoxylon truncatum]
MSLRHINIPSMPWGHPPRCPTYRMATRIQTKLQEDLLAWKAAGSTTTTSTSTSTPSSSSSPAPPPPPALITFTPSPTFTLGRRQDYPSAPERQRMQERLTVSTYRPAPRSSWGFIKPDIVQTPRGGLTTYHGPGQVLFWPVIDLRSPLHKHFTVREYASLLEQTTIAALRRAYDVEGFTDPASPGVWARKVRTVMGPLGEDVEVQGPQEKLASLGVHLRRHVTGLGIAVNFRMNLDSNPKVNPWLRIEPCGHDGTAVTTVAKHVGDIPLSSAVDLLIPTWADEFAKRLGVANAVDPDAGPLIKEDGWTRWILELDLARNPGFEIARKRRSS